jgi:hypothetical protein
MVLIILLPPGKTKKGNGIEERKLNYNRPGISPGQRRKSIRRLPA